MSMMVSGRFRILRRRSRIHFSFISRVMVSASSGYILSNIYSIVKRKDGWKMFPSVLLDRTRSKKECPSGAATPEGRGKGRYEGIM